MSMQVQLAIDNGGSYSSLSGTTTDLTDNTNDWSASGSYEVNVNETLNYSYTFTPGATHADDTLSVTMGDQTKSGTPSSVISEDDDGFQVAFDFQFRRPGAIDENDTEVRNFRIIGVNFRRTVIVKQPQSVAGFTVEFYIDENGIPGALVYSAVSQDAPFKGVVDLPGTAPRTLYQVKVSDNNVSIPDQWFALDLTNSTIQTVTIPII